MCGMLLYTGAQKVKHLSTKQHWTKGAIKSYGMEVQKVPRARDGQLRQCLQRIAHHTHKEW